MSELPNGWIDVPIGELASVIGGGTPKSKDESNFVEGGAGIAWLTPADLSGYSKKTIAHGKRDLSRVGFESCSAKLMPKGSVLFSSRAPIGYVVISDNEICTNQGFKSFVLPKEIDPSYAYYYLKWAKPIAEDMATGTTFKELSGAKAKQLPFILSPLNEQKRIAYKLDRLLAKVDATKTHLDKIPELLKRFRQSVLAAATSGSLTEDWDDETDNYFSEIANINSNDPKSIRGLDDDEIEKAKRLHGNVDWRRWELFPLEYLVESTRGIPYGIVQTGKQFDGGTPTIRCGDVKPLNIDDKQLKLVDPDIASNYSRTKLEGGEVILAIRGTVGNAAVVPRAMKGVNISREVAMIPVVNNVDANYIAILLQSPGGFKCLSEEVRGVAQRGINLADVRRFVVPLPAHDEQIEIVRRVEDLFIIADRIESQFEVARSRVDKLTQSILAKSFRGELVPQDPNDEPAEQLLERIRDQRESEATNKPKPKRATAKAQRKKKKVVKKKAARGRARQAGGQAQISATHKVMKGESAVMSTEAKELLEVIENTFGKKCFKVDQLRDQITWGYDDLKDTLYELIKGNKPIKLQPMLKMQWDGGYQLTLAI